MREKRIYPKECHVVPDPQVHIDKIKKNIDAGFDRICIQQIGNNQEEFIEFCKEEVLPEVH